MSIKAIETKYKGYRFRSRLEARWAVFFDAIGVEWLYEHEGFDLGGEDGWYLPDFWFPLWGCFAEIKPSDMERGCLIKPTALAWNHYQPVMLISGGSPWPDDYRIEYFYPEAGVEWYGEFVLCRKCSGVCLLSKDGSMFREVGQHTCKDNDKYPGRDERIIQAYTAARSARFEHGETP